MSWKDPFSGSRAREGVILGLRELGGSLFPSPAVGGAREQGLWACVQREGYWQVERETKFVSQGLAQTLAPGQCPGLRRRRRAPALDEVMGGSERAGTLHLALPCGD